MTKQEFIAKMQNEVLFTEDDLSMDMVLDGLVGWDSLGFVSFLAMAKESGYLQANRKAVNEAKTIGDLFALVQ